jgi:hypothetical protein
MTHPFVFGSKVIADDDASNPMTVIGILYVPESAVSIKLAYWCNGDHKEVWIDAWRLAPYIDPRKKSL